MLFSILVIFFISLQILKEVQRKNEGASTIDVVPIGVCPSNQEVNYATTEWVSGH